MAKSQAEGWRRGRWEILVVLFRVLGSLMGGLIMFAVWLIIILSGMPRPPVPPSFAVTLTAPIVTSFGFAVGMHVAERLMGRRRTGIHRTFLWIFAGGMMGTVVMFPFGGMMAGFGLFGLGTAALLIREAFLWRDQARHPTTRSN